MNIYLKEIEAPKTMFKHRIEELETGNRNNVQFLQVMKDGKVVNDGIFIMNTFSKQETEQMVVLNRCVEKKYSDHVLDICKKHYYGTGIKQYEWHLERISAVICKETGKTILECDAESDHIYLYGKVIAVVKGSNCRLYDSTGKFLCDCTYENMRNNKEYVVACPSYYYENGKFTVISRSTGEIVAVY